jgi:hypothetical protein
VADTNKRFPKFHRGQLVIDVLIGSPHWIHDMRFEEGDGWFYCLLDRSWEWLSWERIRKLTRKEAGR